jgi:glutathione S-transferase
LFSEAKEPFFAWFMEKDEERKKQMKEKYFTEGVHKNLAAFDEELKKNNGGQGWFIGDSPTWGDFSVAVFIQELRSQKEGLLDKYPILNSHCDRVYHLKGIKEWVAAHSKGH